MTSSDRTAKVTRAVLRLVLPLLVLLPVGCRRLAAYAGAPGDLGTPRDLPGLERSTVDLVRSDTLLEAAPDGLPGCAAPPASPLLHFSFDEPLENGNTLTCGGVLLRPGQLRGSSWSLESGGVCGKALVLRDDTVASYVRVNHESGPFELAEGAVELWVRFDRDPGQLEGVFSRDATYQVESGHLTLMRRPAGHLMVRLQGLGNVAGMACMGASKIVRGQWHHVEVDFGGASPLALYVDGEPGLYTSSEGDWNCGDVAATQGLGIAGNHNPWIIGASAMGSADGLGDADAQLVGAIDEFRLYDRRLHP